jgi:hypothetical protein
MNAENLLSVASSTEQDLPEKQPVGCFSLMSNLFFCFHT